MKYIDEYRNSGAASFLIEEINGNAKSLPRNSPVNIMEVCGSHTMAISRYGIRELLPENINLLSGPGCPVCVTDAGYIDAAIDLAGKGVIIATFGDMINVPGSEKNTLAKSRSEGSSVEICYSPLSAINTAETNPDKEIVFLGIGFETTIAPVISTIDTASDKNIKNLTLLTAFKLVPPVLEALVTDPELKIDAFLCPAHVSVIIGANAYKTIANKYNIPCVIASFEPVEILFGINSILKQLVNKTSGVENNYERVVTCGGNKKAQKLISKYLEEDDASWRGIGIIPKSGLKLKKEFSKFDASEKFGIRIKTSTPDKNCKCGDVLKGKIRPFECPLYSKVCNPSTPIGPCMVSSEGTCSAYYKYSKKN